MKLEMNFLPPIKELARFEYHQIQSPTIMTAQIHHNFNGCNLPQLQQLHGDHLQQHFQNANSHNSNNTANNHSTHNNNNVIVPTTSTLVNTTGKLSQYQTIWRQYVVNSTVQNGTSKNNQGHLLHNNNNSTNGAKELNGAFNSLLDDIKKDDDELWHTHVDSQTNYNVGPNLWDKSCESDFKYVDLDDFLTENGVSMDGLDNHTNCTNNVSNMNYVMKRERSGSPSDCMSPDTMNPPSPADSTLSMSSSIRNFDTKLRNYSDDDLKPMSVVKKSRKQFVPDELKDEKYWARRRKNNMAAKRSRDARRMKETQIAQRANFLEKENISLRQENERLRNEIVTLRHNLTKFTDIKTPTI